MATASWNGRYLSRPWITVLSYSAGTGSHALLEMVLRGELERPEVFVVTNADPGMEAKGTYDLIESVKPRLAAAGIPLIQVKRNLYREILELKASGKTRFDTPPFWTKDRETGKVGRLLQGCTGAYKVAPMDAALRQWMHDNLGVSKKTKALGERCVRKWIGFTADEADRVKPAGSKYQFFEYPLIERGIDRIKLVGLYLKWGVKVPPRSVCNACYANDVNYFRDMCRERPDDWAQAVAVDDEIRDLTCIGVRDLCFVSATAIPLRDLEAANFEIDDVEAEIRCHSGHCFV